MKNALCTGIGLLVVGGCMAPAELPQGLHVRGGKLMRSGEEFRAMGINYNTCFLNLISNGDCRDFAEGFRRFDLLVQAAAFIINERKRLF